MLPNLKFFLLFQGRQVDKPLVLKVVLAIEPGSAS